MKVKVCTWKTWKTWKTKRIFKPLEQKFTYIDFLHYKLSCQHGFGIVVTGQP